MKAVRWIWLLFLLPLLAVSAQQGLREDLQVTLVSLYVSAVDSAGNVVTDLKTEDFSLYENGTLQTINTFNHGDDDISLTVAFVMDNSASISGADLDLARSAGLLLLREMKPTDKFFLITFRHDMSSLVEPTFEKKKIEDTLRSLKPQYGTTALYDSIYLASKKLDHELGRKVLLLFSDGQDNSSERKLNDLLAGVAALSDITVISVGTRLHPISANRFGAAEEHKKGRDALMRLSDITGGFSIFPENQDELGRAVVELRNWIRNQYTIGYYPDNRLRDGAWRAIRLQCKRKGIRLNYRKGYFAPGKPETIQTDGESIFGGDNGQTQRR